MEAALQLDEEAVLLAPAAEVTRPQSPPALLSTLASCTSRIAFLLPLIRRTLPHSVALRFAGVPDSGICFTA